MWLRFEILFPILIRNNFYIRFRSKDLTEFINVRFKKI